MLLLIGLTTDVFTWNGEGCFSQDVQLCSMYYVVVIREVTTHDPKVFTVFLLEKGILFILFIMLKRFPLAGSSPRGG